ncbi:hypothetical protein N9B82_05520 [Saprospiraceae bacterium]|nr:hypothetical protein [Saprospiraceae bacterium]
MDKGWEWSTFGRSRSDERPAKPWNSAVPVDEGDWNGSFLQVFVLSRYFIVIIAFLYLSGK